MPESLVPAAIGRPFLPPGWLPLLPGGLRGAIPTPGEHDGGDRYYRYERQPHEKRPKPSPYAAFAPALAILYIDQQATSSFVAFGSLRMVRVYRITRGA